MPLRPAGGPGAVVVIDADEYATTAAVVSVEPDCVRLGGSAVWPRLGVKAWKDRLVVCQCKSGRRSMKALDTLQKHGFRKLVNLEGGILGWGEHTGDPGIAPY